jgi:EPS-associated MarR family transcriptional regulator
VPEVRTMDDSTRLRLLRLLTERPDINQRELAQRLGLSLGKANYCVRALVEKGWIKIENFRSSRHKMGYAYVLTPSGVRARMKQTVDFLRRKQREYAQLEREIDELRREAARLRGGAKERGGESWR